MSRTLKCLRDFKAADSGAIAPLFGLMMMAMLILVGVSIDGARGTRISLVASNALDAAALAAAKTLRLNNPTDEELTALVQDYFNSNFVESNAAAVLNDLVVVVDRTINSVSLVAKVKVPTTITALLGSDYMDVNLNASAVYDVKDVEVSMMLDVSGSMSGTKLADLKLAAKDLVDIMLPLDTPHENRVAIAPFSTSVNAGSLAATVSYDGRRSRAGTTCVTERAGAEAFTDASPTTNLLKKETTSCPTSAVLPLTNNIEDLHDAIDAMNAGGLTAGHLGISWAWYLLSPEWSSVLPGDSAPTAYDNPEVRKVAILMTDGMFNTYYEGDNGNSVAQARALCDNMKAEGVTVFTVGFQVPAEVVPTLQYCATSPKHWYPAEDGVQLRKTFKEIANRLNGLRLSS